MILSSGITNASNHFQGWRRHWGGEQDQEQNMALIFNWVDCPTTDTTRQDSVIRASWTETGGGTSSGDRPVISQWVCAVLNLPKLRATEKEQTQRRYQGSSGYESRTVFHTKD